VGQFDDEDYKDVIFPRRIFYKTYKTRQVCHQVGYYSTAS